jgi:hypothetical protein
VVPTLVNDIRPNVEKVEIKVKDGYVKPNVVPLIELENALLIVLSPMVQEIVKKNISMSKLQ